jgi:hypothetical protein
VTQTKVIGENLLPNPSKDPKNDSLVTKSSSKLIHGKIDNKSRIDGWTDLLFHCSHEDPLDSHSHELPILLVLTLSQLPN